MNIDLTGKVAIVTGADRGIGREIATTLAGEGVVTAVTDVRQDLLDDLAREFATRGWRGAYEHTRRRRPACTTSRACSPASWHRGTSR